MYRLPNRIVVFILLTATTPHAADAETAANLTRGPYLQLATPTSCTVVWRTSGPTRPTVRYGRDRGKLDQACEPDNIVVRGAAAPVGSADPAALHSAPVGTVQYEAKLAGLDADTTYYYAVYDGTKKLAGDDAHHSFRTHPVVGTKKPLRMWVVGDSGTGDVNQKAVFSAMQRYVEREKRPVDLYLHVGDMAYPKGTDAEFQRNFFEVYQPLLRNTVCWAAMGNHEGATSKGLFGTGPYYDAYVCPKRGEAGGLASATEAYYSFDYGSVHFICLDSHDLDRDPLGVMAQWLKADLEKTKADWIIGFWHHPPYTKGSHDSDKESQLIEMRELIMPIMESGGVDLVLTGHSHIYERSMLIDGAYHTPTTAAGVVLNDGDGDPKGDGPYRKSAGINPHQGTVQVVTGHGGAKVSRKGTSPIMKRVVVEHGSTLVDVADDILSITMVNGLGEIRDVCQLVKQGTVTPQIVAAPRVLPPYTPPLKKPAVEPTKAAGIPTGAIAVVEKHAEWDYLAGKSPPKDWTEVAFVPEETAGWKVGSVGIGYGDDDDATVLKNMKGNYTTVYARTEFELEPGEKNDVTELGLVISYDDAFIAYLNGREVLRVGVGKGSGPTAKDIKSHNAQGYEYFSLKHAIPYLEDDDNILAVEGHNSSNTSSDFSLDPYVVAVKKKSLPKK
jgi:hypothetical protein